MWSYMVCAARGLFEQNARICVRRIGRLNPVPGKIHLKSKPACRVFCDRPIRIMSSGRPESRGSADTSGMGQTLRNHPPDCLGSDLKNRDFLQYLRQNEGVMQIWLDGTEREWNKSGTKEDQTSDTLGQSLSTEQNNAVLRFPQVCDGMLTLLKISMRLRTWIRSAISTEYPGQHPDFKFSTIPICGMGLVRRSWLR